MDQSGGTGSGVLAPQEVLANESDTMAGSSKTSAKTGKPSTGKRQADSPLTESEVLAILENSLQRVRVRWGQVSVNKFGGRCALLLPEGIGFCAECQHLRVLAEIENGICRPCRERS